MFLPPSVMATVVVELTPLPIAYSVWSSIEATDVLSFVSLLVGVGSALIALIALGHTKTQAQAAKDANTIAEQAKKQSEAANEISQTANQHGVQSLEIAKEANKLSRQANKYSELSHEREMGRGFVEISVALIPMLRGSKTEVVNGSDLLGYPIDWYLQINNDGPGTAFKLSLELLILTTSEQYHVEALEGWSSVQLPLGRRLKRLMEELIELRTDRYNKAAPREIVGTVTSSWKKFDGAEESSSLRNQLIPLLFSNHASFDMWAGPKNPV